MKWLCSTKHIRVFQKNRDHPRYAVFRKIDISLSSDLQIISDFYIAQSAGAIEYTDCTSAEG